MQLDIYIKTTIETETIVYDIVREWQTVYTHKSITFVIPIGACRPGHTQVILNHVHSYHENQTRRPPI